MVTVIIPTLNEEKTIRSVIELISKSPLVSEILVVDDKSFDDTLEEAQMPLTKIYTSTRLGKGASMREGMLLASNDIVAYLDADIPSYPDNIIEMLTIPLVNDEVDFVKSCFDRQAGRVTELVAKPLISILFPALTRFSQPLSGMIAGKKDFLKKLAFENDYGVDIGILIDMYLLGARIREVNIGYIENKMQTWDQLSKMSREVSRSILKRASKMEVTSLETLEDISVVRTQMEFAIRESLKGLKKMIIFDMDNTILKGSFISTAADEFGFRKELVRIVTESDNSYIRTKTIAKLMTGKSIDVILNVVDNIEIVEDAKDVIKELKQRGYITGIISDSYDVVTNHIKNKLGMNFSIANELEFSRSIATGEVKVPSYFFRTHTSKCHHDICKSNVLFQIAEKYSVDVPNIISVGDSENDICLVRESGIGIAFCSENKMLNIIADKVINEKSFKSILDIAH